MKMIQEENMSDPNEPYHNKGFGLAFLTIILFREICHAVEAKNTVNFKAPQIRSVFTNNHTWGTMV